MVRRASRLGLVLASILALAAAAASAGEPPARADHLDALALSGLKADAFPNPVGLHATVRVVAAIAEGAHARDASQPMRLPGELTLVDLGGRRVATLWKGTLDRLTFEVPLLARDERGARLAPGLYFLVFRAGSHAVLSRVAIMR